MEESRQAVIELDEKIDAVEQQADPAGSPQPSELSQSQALPICEEENEARRATDSQFGRAKSKRSGKPLAIWRLPWKRRDCETLKQSDNEIEALGQKARDLATFVETTRMRTLKQSDNEVEALGQKARDLATFVEASRLQTLKQSDHEIEALVQKARDLATFVEALRMQTLMQSDGKIEALGQKARDLATFVETARSQALNQSNKEIRKLNEELEQRVLERTAQLEAANKELDAFSYSVSHDLRAPLRAIDGFSRIVLDDFGDSLPAEGKSYLQMVRDNTRQMGQLVDDLLAFARLGRQPLTEQAVESEQRCPPVPGRNDEGAARPTGGNC